LRRPFGKLRAGLPATAKQRRNNNKLQIAGLNIVAFGAIPNTGMQGN